MKESRFNEHYIKFSVDFNLNKGINMKKGYLVPDLMNDLKFYSIGTTKLVKRYMKPIIASVIKNMCKRNRLKFNLSEFSTLEYESMTLLFNYNRNNNPIISRFDNENFGSNDKQKDFLEDVFKPSIFVRLNLNANEEENEFNTGNNYLEEVTIKIPVYYGIDIDGEELLFSRILLINNNIFSVSTPYQYEIKEYTLKETRNGMKGLFTHASESKKTTSFVDKDSLLLDSITYLRLTNSLNEELMNIDEEDEEKPKFVSDILYILNAIKTKFKEDEKKMEYKDLTDSEIQDRLEEMELKRKILSKLLYERNHGRNS